MKYSLEDLIKYRLGRAEECLDEAKLLAEEDHWNTVTNRLYYALFYSVNALLIKNNIRATSHSGTKNEFHKHFIKTGYLEIRYGKLYSELFDKRQEGDYQVFKRFTDTEIKPLINMAVEFVQTIKKTISEK